MNLNEYQANVRRIVNRNLPLWAAREHALYGLIGEMGAVAHLHRMTHEGHPMDDSLLRLKIGDVLQAVAELCDVYGWTMDEIAEANVRQLLTRYPRRKATEDRMPRKSRHYAAGEGRKRI